MKNNNLVYNVKMNISGGNFVSLCSLYSYELASKYSNWYLRNRFDEDGRDSCSPFEEDFLVLASEALKK